MKREYWIILMVYIGMQLSSLMGVPLFLFIFKYAGISRTLVVPYWLIFSFSIALIVVLYILRKEMKGSLRDERGESLSLAIVMAIIGIPLAFIAQYVAAYIELLLGIQPGSENTKQILEIIGTFHLAMLVSSVFGPILEEIVFRKIIFGALYKRLNFFLSALISSVIFALAHMEPVHILLYSAMGFTFAFLYVVTKRIWVPIIAHVSMNTIVVLLQYVFKDEIQKMIRDAEAVQHFIGGFL